MLRLQDAAVVIWATMRVEYVAGCHALQRMRDDGTAGEAEHGCSNRWVEATVITVSLAS
jgi:hypothetical protein